MFLSLFVSSIENSLMALEASNVIAMRLQMFCKGDVQALRESELILSEKIDAFYASWFCIAAGGSNTMMNFRTAIQANEARLSALRISA
jgi:hypothetical protein